MKTLTKFRRTNRQTANPHLATLKNFSRAVHNRTHPANMPASGFTLTEVLVVVVILVVLAAIAVALFTNQAARAQSGTAKYEVSAGGETLTRYMSESGQTGIRREDNAVLVEGDTGTSSVPTSPTAHIYVWVSTGVEDMNQVPDGTAYEAPNWWCVEKEGGGDVWSMTPDNSTPVNTPCDLRFPHEPASDLNAPADLNPTPSNQRVALTWTAPAGDVAYYKVEYKRVSDPDWTVADGNVTDVFYTVSGLFNNREYDFQVTPYDSNDARGDSSTTSATPSLPTGVYASLSLTPGGVYAPYVSSSQPQSSVVLPDGTVYFTENSGNSATGHFLKKIAPDGTVSTIIGQGGAGTGQRGWRVAGGNYDPTVAVPLADALLNEPRGLAYRDGKLYVANRGRNNGVNNGTNCNNNLTLGGCTIRVVDLDAGTITGFVGTGRQGGFPGTSSSVNYGAAAFAPQNVAGTSFNIREAAGLTFDGSDLWFAALGDGCIYQMPGSTKTVGSSTMTAGNVYRMYCLRYPTAGQGGGQVNVNSLTAVGGAVYATSYWGVTRIDPDTAEPLNGNPDAVQNILLYGGTVSSGQPLGSGDGTLYQPSAVSAGPNGNAIYVGQACNVLKIDVDADSFSTSTISNFAGGYNSCSNVDNADLQVARFGSGYGVAGLTYYNKAGAFVVADGANNRIRQMNP